MTKPVITIQNLSKKYLLQRKQQTYATFRESIQEGLKQIFRGKYSGRVKEEFYALHDVSFSINQGERLGIIGRNGAGKSTLLKILSRIVTPSGGNVTIEGRVASLLEVGTGFHPELSGRENIFLNGSILGMSKDEIKRKFDEIVAFAEVEKFLDTPVKRYSSGMYVRLAFAVAAHLEPEILIVDEVLAVGDVEFQKKCLGKMKDVAGNGRTVLFVSHNMGAIQSLCSKVIILSNGNVSFNGDTNNGVSKYLSNGNIQATDLANRTDRTGNGNFKFSNISILNDRNEFINETLSGENIFVKVSFLSKSELKLGNMIISIAFIDDFQNIVLAYISDEMGTNFSFLKMNGEFILEIPELLLRGGKYAIKLFASYGDTLPENICDAIENATSLLVISNDFWNSGKTIRNGNYSVLKGTYHD